MHLGSKLSDLLDGRLGEAEEERCWSHVHTCPPCRDLVEREGWLKQRLAGLGSTGAAPSDLKASLLGAGAFSVGESVFASDHLGEARRTWSRGMVTVSGGALGAAVIGMVALSGNLAGSVRPPTVEDAEISVPMSVVSSPPADAPATTSVSSLTPVGVVQVVVALRQQSADAAENARRPTRRQGVKPNSNLAPTHWARGTMLQ